MLINKGDKQMKGYESLIVKEDTYRKIKKIAKKKNLEIEKLLEQTFDALTEKKEIPRLDHDISIAEASLIFDRTRHCIMLWINEGKLKAYKNGYRTFITLHSAIELKKKMLNVNYYTKGEKK